jgi:hemerythrin-like domain-containing protein
LSENIFDIILEEHKEFKEMLAKIIDGNKDKEDSFEELKKEIEAHIKAEEQTLYECLKQDKKGRGLTLVGVEEHRIGTGVLNKLDRSTNKWNHEWKIQAIVLKHLLEKHIEVEEEEVLPLAKEMLSKKVVDELSENFEAIEERIEKGM